MIKVNLEKLIKDYKGYLELNYPYPKYSKKEMLSDIIIDLENILDGVER